MAVQVIAAAADQVTPRLFTIPQQRFLKLIRNQPANLVATIDSMDLLWSDWELSL